MTLVYSNSLIDWVSFILVTLALWKLLDINVWIIDKIYKLYKKKQEQEV